MHRFTEIDAITDIIIKEIDEEEIELGLVFL
jgi:hypothetical protein